MTDDDAKSWMLAHSECEELHCRHLFVAAATQEEPAERDCACPYLCPHSEIAQARFKAVREEVAEEALTESWETLVGAIETLLDAPMRGPALDAAVLALRRRANDLIDEHTTKTMEHRHEL